MRSQEFIDARNAVYEEYIEEGQVALRKLIAQTADLNAAFNKAEEEYRNAVREPNREYIESLDRSRIEYKEKVAVIEEKFKGK